VGCNAHRSSIAFIKATLAGNLVNRKLPDQQVGGKPDSFWMHGVSHGREGELEGKKKGGQLGKWNSMRWGGGGGGLTIFVSSFWADYSDCRAVRCANRVARAAHTFTVSLLPSTSCNRPLRLTAPASPPKSRNATCARRKRSRGDTSAAPGSNNTWLVVLCSHPAPQPST